MVSEGLRRLSQCQKVTVSVTGYEVRATRRVKVEVSAALLCQPESDTVKAEVMTFEDGKLVSREAADGENLWVYDVRSNSYTSSAYAKDGKLVADWQKRLFQTLRLRTTGATSFGLRILDDAFGTGLVSGEWLPWIPTATIERQETHVVCTATNPNLNNTVYYLNGDDDTGFDLVGATFEQAGRTGTETSWSLTIEKDKLPSDVIFGFVPPRNAHATAVDQRDGG